MLLHHNHINQMNHSSDNVQMMNPPGRRQQIARWLLNSRTLNRDTNSIQIGIYLDDYGDAPTELTPNNEYTMLLTYRSYGASITQ